MLDRSGGIGHVRSYPDGAVGPRRRPLSRVILSISLVVAACGVLLVSAHDATAYVQLDPQDTCQLHSYLPHVDGVSYQPQGSVTCPNYPSDFYLQVCGQVDNGGTWYDVSGSCFGYESSWDPSDSAGGYFYVGYTDSGIVGKWDQGVCGHTYRTHDWGSDEYTDYAVKTSQSNGETQCS